jgi:tellurite resistance-related uncharacterized protein
MDFNRKISSLSDGNSAVDGMDDNNEENVVGDCFHREFRVPGKNATVDHSRRLQIDLTCKPELVQQVKDLGSVHKKNLLLSAEYLTNPNTRIMDMDQQVFIPTWSTSKDLQQDTTESKKSRKSLKKPKIIGYYRRYYLWLLSLHNQIFKYKLPPARFSIIRFINKEYKNMALKNKYNSTQSKWGRDYIMNAIVRYNEYYNNHNTSDAITTGNNKNSSSNVFVYNIHNITDIREHFFCIALINATHTCSEIKKLIAEQDQSKVTSQRKPQQNQQRRRISSSNAAATTITTQRAEVVVNPSIPLVYSEMVYYAIKMNLINNLTYIPISTKKITVFDQVYNTYLIPELRLYHEITLNRTLYDFGGEHSVSGGDRRPYYQTCLNDTVLDWLYTKSLNTEQILFPEFYNSTGYYDISHEFGNLRTTKLCHINVELILQKEQLYRTFFETIVAKVASAQ